MMSEEKKNENENKDEKIKKIYLSTDIDELDSILSMDEDSLGGFLIGRVVEQSNVKQSVKLETPIILINGATGTGKTTLTLQIASSAAKGAKTEKERNTREETDEADRKKKETETIKCFPCFYALEQSTLSLKSLASNFGNFKNEKRESPEAPEVPEVQFCDLVEISHDDRPFDKNANQIHLCHLSPRPISEVAPEDVFEQRFAELSHMVHKFNRKASEVSKEAFVIFFIDSINAFSTNPLSRNEIYRIFSLLRNNHIPAILTMERHQGSYSVDEYSSLECAKFLSDVVINLEKDTKKDYLLHFLEIEKSRISLQALGKHLYKIRSKPAVESIEMDPRTGFVLYPSIHSVLSRASRQSNRENPAKKGPTQAGPAEKEQTREDPATKRFVICERGDKDLLNVMLTNEINPGEFLAIVGPRGSHKLALGMNLAIGCRVKYRNEGKKTIREKEPPRLLIVNFGGSGDFKFEGVAWTEKRSYLRGLKRTPGSETNETHTKFWRTDYNVPGRKKAFASIITFKIGHLTTEECFYIINKTIDEAETPFSSVLISDAAELCSGFPLLVSDPMFLPALIDLFTTRGLVSVCIGVDSAQPEANLDINFSLLSRADYRIVLSHYPERYKLYKKIVQTTQEKLQNAPPGEDAQPTDNNDNSYNLSEQLVCLVIDNVSGKHYGREPRWLWAEEQGAGKKTLRCSKKVLDYFLSTSP